MNVYLEKYPAALIFEVYGIIFSLQIKKNEFKLSATNFPTNERRLLDKDNLFSFSDKCKKQIEHIINCMNINNMYIHIKSKSIYIKILHDTFITPNGGHVISYWSFTDDDIKPVTSLATYQALSESEQANIEMLLGNINTYTIALAILNI